MLNILISYAYIKDRHIGILKPLIDDGYCRLFLDSGAFTAFSSGKPIQLDDYCRFLEQMPIRPWRYFTLDVIGDPEKTMRNYETMVSRGFSPVPIVTLNDGGASLEAFYQTSDIVALGGLVGTPAKKRNAFIAKMMKAIKGRKVHWLGVVDDKMVKHFKPYSCDSSSVEGAGRFGTVNLYLGNGKHMTIGRDHFKSMPSAKIQNALKKYGLQLSDFSRKDNWRAAGDPLRKPFILANCHSYVLKSLDYEKHIGTKVFLAIGADHTLQGVVDRYKKIKQMGV